MLCIPIGRRPGKSNNADNPVFLTKKDFDLVSTSNKNDSLILFFKSKESTIDLQMVYRLAPNDFLRGRILL